MATSMTNLFNFGRPLPEPFEKLPNKKVKGAASKYGALEATLCASVLKGVNAFCACVNGTGQGAVGNIEGQRYVAEYKSSMGADTYHLVVYDASTGNFLASVYDRDTELIEQYTAHPSARDGAALFFAMMPKLLEDQEFKENFQVYREQRKDGFPDLPKAVNTAAILCDNAYRRVKDESCRFHVKVRVDKSGVLMRVSRTQLDSGALQARHGPCRGVHHLFQHLRETCPPARPSHRAQGLCGKISPDPRQEAVRRGTVLGACPSRVVCHSPGSGGHLQARQAHHGKARPDAEFPAPRPSRHRQDHGGQGHRCGAGTALHEVHLLAERRFTISWAWCFPTRNTPPGMSSWTENGNSCAPWGA